MSLTEVMSGGNGSPPPANPTSANPGASGKGAAQSPNPQLETTASAAETEPGGSPQGSETGGITLAPWATQIPKELRENHEYAKKLAGFSKLEDLVKDYLSIEGRTSIPNKNAKPEEVDAFWKQLGRPEKPEGYSVAKENESAAFLAAAHAARLTDEQASALWKESREQMNRHMAAALEAQTKELAASDAALKKEYGEKYDYALEMFKRGLGDGDLKTRIMQSGLAGNQELVKAFIALGEARQESGSPKSGTVRGAKDYMNGSWY